MEALDIQDALTHLSKDFSDPDVVVETVGNLYPELEFDVNEFGGHTDEINDTASLTCSLPNEMRDDGDEEMVDIETIDDDCPMAKRLTTSTQAAAETEQTTSTEPVQQEMVETEIVFPDMEGDTRMDVPLHTNTELPFLDNMDGIEAEDMNSLFAQFENQDGVVGQEEVIEEVVTSSVDDSNNFLYEEYRPAQVHQLKPNSSTTKHIIQLSLPQPSRNVSTAAGLSSSTSLIKTKSSQPAVSLVNKEQLLNKVSAQQPKGAGKAKVSLVNKQPRVIQIGKPRGSNPRFTVPVKLTFPLGADGKPIALLQPSQMLVKKQPGAGDTTSRSPVFSSWASVHNQKAKSVTTSTSLLQTQPVKPAIISAPNKLISVINSSNTLLTNKASTQSKVNSAKISSANAQSPNKASALNATETSEVGLSLQLPSTRAVVKTPKSESIITSNVEADAMTTCRIWNTNNASKSSVSTEIESQSNILSSCRLSGGDNNGEEIIWVNTDDVTSDVCVETVVCTDESSEVDISTLEKEMLTRSYPCDAAVDDEMTLTSHDNDLLTAVDDFNSVVHEEVTVSTSPNLEHDPQHASVSEEKPAVVGPACSAAEHTALCKDEKVNAGSFGNRTPIKTEPMDIADHSYITNNEAAQSGIMRRPPWLTDSAHHSRPGSGLSSRPPTRPQSRTESRAESWTSSRNTSRKSSPKHWRRSPSPQEMLLNKIPGYLSALAPVSGGPSLDDSALTTASSLLREGQSDLIVRDPSPNRHDNVGDTHSDYNRLPGYCNSFSANQNRDAEEPTTERRKEKKHRKHKKHKHKKISKHRAKRRRSRSTSLSDESDADSQSKKKNLPRRYRTPSIDLLSSSLSDFDSDSTAADDRRDNFKRRCSRHSRSRSPLSRTGSHSRHSSRHKKRHKRRSRSYSASSSDSYESSSYRDRDNRRRRYRDRSDSYSSYSSRSRSRSSGRRSSGRRSKRRNNRRYGNHRQRTRHRTDRSSSPKSRAKQLAREAHDKAMAERRVVYVGGIPESHAPSDLRLRFDEFGEIETTSVHFRQRGDNYGFVTYYTTESAKRAIEGGNKRPGRKFNLCYGGRRTFCKTDYADLDGCTAVKEEWALHEMKREDPADDFDALLRQTLKKITT